MGIYLFAGQALTWLPPLVFTAMNEAGVSIRLSMLSLVSFWIIALFFLQCMGSFSNVIEEVIPDAPVDLSLNCAEVEIISSNKKYVTA